MALTVLVPEIILNACVKINAIALRIDSVIMSEDVCVKIPVQIRFIKLHIPSS